MKRKIGEYPYKRAGGWWKPAGNLHFRLGAVGDEPNGKTVTFNENKYGKIRIGWHRGKNRPLIRAVFLYLEGRVYNYEKTSLKNSRPYGSS
jgi:hypothetical protein